MAQAKLNGKIDWDAEDEVVRRAVRAATEFVATQTGRALMLTGYEMTRRDWWSDCLPLEVAPFREVTELAFLDPDGDEISVDPAQYHTELTEEGAVLVMESGWSAPGLASRGDAVRVRFTAGYDDPAASGSGDDPELRIPERARQAVLLLAGHWYEHREEVNVGNIVSTFAMAGEALMHQLRIFR